MSALFFFASDAPLAEVENPHYKTYSVREALEKGLAVPDFILRNPDFDREKPGVLLWADPAVETKIDPITQRVADNGVADDFSIRPIPHSSEIYTNRPYLAALEWDCFSPGRAVQVLAYIRAHLEQAQELEIWHIWLAGEEKPQFRRREISLEELSAEDLRKMDEVDFVEPLMQYCWTIKKIDHS